jgi:hypothetical protein
VNDADINFHFDPLCPFAWMTSKRARQVTVQRDHSVDWRFTSLRMIYASVDYDSRLLAGYEADHTAGLLGVAARTRAEHGRQAVDSAAAPTLGPEERGSREFVEPLLGHVDLPAGLASALDDTSWDGELRVETGEALALTGKDGGTPIIHFGPPRGTAFRAGHQPLPTAKRQSGCGTTLPGSPPSLASPSSSAACENGSGSPGQRLSDDGRAAPCWAGLAGPLRPWPED